MSRYYIQQRAAGWARYRVKREMHRGLVAVNGVSTPTWMFLTLRGAERWISRRERTEDRRTWR